MRVRKIECQSWLSDENAARRFYEIVARVFTSVPPLDVWWVPGAIGAWADATDMASRGNYNFDAWNFVATVVTATSGRTVEVKWRPESYFIESSVVDFGENGSIGAAMEVLVHVQPSRDRYGLRATVTMIDGRIVTPLQAIEEMFEEKDELRCHTSPRTFSQAEKIAGR